MLQEQAVPKHTLELLKRISSPLADLGFYLVGGTALALRLGHRISIDLDFFKAEVFSPPALIKNLDQFSAGQSQIMQQTKGSITAILQGTKLEFIRYESPLLEPLDEIDGITLASLPDNVAMKLSALAGRGSKKDFVDIDALLKTIELETMITWFQTKYPRSDIFMVKKSLTWFVDAEEEPDPVFLNNQTWDGVKKNILSALRS